MANEIEIKKTPTWAEKYRPKYFHDIRGQDLAVDKLRAFVKKPMAGKSIALHGPPGTGKTSLAYVIANETKSEIFELNASDLRDREKINEILKPVTEQKSLTNKGKVILVDEVDGISEVDRGGLSELISLIESSSQPIIITANDIWDKKFSELRKVSELVQLKEINYKTIKEILVEILRKEKKFIDNDVLTDIAVKSKGDLRAAINDVQIAASLPNPYDIIIDERNKEIDIFSAMRLIFKGKPNNALLKLFDSVNMPLEEVLLWIEENIPAEYQGAELAKAYDSLSKVDIFKKRIYRQQYWRFLVYENALLSYGVSSAKKTEKLGFTSYKKPTRILKMWMNNQQTVHKKSIAKKYSKYVHIGERRALREFPTFKAFLQKPEIQKELRLSEDEIAYLMK